MYDRTYHGVSRLAKEYFVVMCRQANLYGNYNWTEEETNCSSQTYTVELQGKEAYTLMQKVFEAQNS